MPVFHFRYWLGTKEAVRNGSSDSNHAHRPMTARASGFASPPYAVVFATFFRPTRARAGVGTGHHFFSSPRRRLCSIGRATGRERESQYVWIAVDGDLVKQKNNKRNNTHITQQH